MHTRSQRLVAAALIAALVPALAACTSPQPTSGTTPAVTPVPTTTPEPTASVEPSAPAETAAPGASTGAITTPASGSAVRAAILQAASKGLHVSGGITVYQLFTQGGAAVGDILPSSGVRTFFALTGGPGAWKLAWSAPFGSSKARASAIVAAAPDVSGELAGKLDFTKTVAKKKVYPAPTLSSFRTFALKSATSMAGGSFTGTFTVTATIAKDSSGSWWGSATAEPSDSSLEPIGVWGHYVSGKWTGEIADFSSEDAAAGFFPPSVLGKLGL